MKSKRIILFLFPLLAYFIIPAGFVFASVGYTGSGFGNTNINVQFCDSGSTHNGAVLYTNANGAQLTYENFGYWGLVQTFVDDSHNDYESLTGSTTAPDISTWTIGAFGANNTAPAGTLASSTCAGGGGGGGGGGSGTSTPADLIIYNADIYPFIFGLAGLLFFLAFWITLKA